MSTPRQIEANRRNAQKSTGPTSVTGKAASAMNALKTGIHAQSLVLPTEDPAEFDELVEDSYRSFHPTTPEARSLVDEFIYCEWNLRRLRAAETQSWQHQDLTAFHGPTKYPLGYSATVHSTTFSRLQYRMDATRRARERALQSLKQLQAEAAAAPAAPDPLPEPPEPAAPPSLTPSTQTTLPVIGFVLPTPSSKPGTLSKMRAAPVTDETGMGSAVFAEPAASPVCHRVHGHTAPIFISPDEASPHNATDMNSQPHPPETRCLLAWAFGPRNLMKNLWGSQSWLPPAFSRRLRQGGFSTPVCPAE